MNIAARFSLLRGSLWLVAFVFAVIGAQAQTADLGAVRQRMSARLAQLDALKAEGALGETNTGYLEVRASAAGAADLVAAENADRKAVYQAIAKQTGSSADDVGRARARQIAASSAPGVWVQEADGTWSRKAG